MAAQPALGVIGGSGLYAIEALTDVRFWQEYDAILLTGGSETPRDLKVPGRELNGIHFAMDFLRANTRALLANGGVLDIDAALAAAGAESPFISAKGKKVIVIGGGDTAMDCVRTSIREGATSVKCLYRRDRANMPGSAREVKNAEEEGAEFSWLARPVAFVGEELYMLDYSNGLFGRYDFGSETLVDAVSIHAGPFGMGAAQGGGGDF